METIGVNHNNKITKKYWTLREDEILLQLVQRQGARNWISIASHLEGRTEHSCRLRWLNHLNPMLKKTPLDKHEEQKLLRLHRIFGNKWAIIARYFPGRTDNQLKNRYYNLQQSRYKQQISGSSQNQDHSTIASDGSTSTLTHLREEIDLNYPPTSTLCHLCESCISPLLSTDQSGSGLEDHISYEFNASGVPSLSRVGVDQAERIIHGGESDIPGSSNGLSMVSDATPVPELNSVREEPMDEQMTPNNAVFFDFLGVNE